MQSIPRPRGFTLIELLTLITIIAKNAAILFPLAGTVREHARTSSSVTNLHPLRAAAHVYQEDEFYSGHNTISDFYSAFDSAPDASHNSPATLYVAPTPKGSDLNPGTIDAPLATLQRAANLAVPGSIIQVASGTYAQTVVIKNSGTPDHPIILRSEELYGAKLDLAPLGNSQLHTAITLKGSYICVSGFHEMNASWIGVSIENQHNYVRQCIFDSNGYGISDASHGGQGIRITAAGSYSVLDAVRVYRSKEHGCYLTSGSKSMANYVTVTDSEFRDNGYGNSGTTEFAGLQINPGGEGIVFRNNIVSGNSGPGINVSGPAGVRNLMIINNLVYGNKKGAFLLAGSHSNTILEYNTAWSTGNTGRGALNLSVNTSGQGIHLLRNVFVSNNSQALKEEAFQQLLTSDYNDYWCMGKKPVAFVGKPAKHIYSLPEWITASGMDLHSLSLDPLYVDPENGNFALKFESPLQDRDIGYSPNR